MENKFIPQYKGSIEGYVKNQVHRNYWRLCRSREKEDIYQDSFILFLKLVKMYPNIDTPQWFMGIYRRCFHNYMVNVSLEDTEYRTIGIQAGVSEDIDEDLIRLIENAVGQIENEGYSNLLVKKAPSEIRSVLSLIINCPTELLDLAQSALGERKDVLANQFLCRMVGKDPVKVDLVAEIRNYLRPKSI